MSEAASEPLGLPLDAVHHAGLQARLRTAAGGAALAVAAVGLLSFLGWVLGSDGLKAPLVPGITMKTNTALCLLFGGLALWLRLPVQPHPARRTSAVVFSAIVAAIGGLTLLEYLTGWNPGLDQALVREAQGAPATESPNRMGVPASLSFTLLGLGLLVLDHPSRRARGMSQTCALFVAATSLLPILGYCCGAQELYGLAGWTGIALQTAVSLHVFAVGLLAIRPDRGVAALFCRQDAGGALMRRVLLPAVLLPMAFGVLVAFGFRGSYYDGEFGISVMALILVLSLGGLIWHYCVLASRADQQRRRAEVEQEQARRWFERVASTSPDIVFVLDIVNDRNVFANRSLVSVLGYSPEELRQVEHIVHRVIHPEDVPGAESFYAAMAVAQPGEVRVLTSRVLHKDGSIRWLESRVTPFTSDGQGRWREVLGVARDLTNRVRAEEKLRLSEERYRLFFDRSPDGVFVVDSTGRFVVVNPACELISGYSPQELLDKRFADICAPDRLEHTVRSFSGQMVAGGYNQFETALIRKDGRRVELWVAGETVYDGGRLVGMHCTAKDITERVRGREELERQVAERTRELRETNEQLNAFCYSVAHDLKAPLRAQSAFATILETEYGAALGETGCHYAHRIAEAAERQSRLITDLLAHMSVSRADLPLQPVELARVLQQVRTDLVIEIQQKHARLHIGPVEGAVLANEASLHLLLQNLLSNALKFVAPGVCPVVRIWAERIDLAPPAGPDGVTVCQQQAQRVRIWVEDNGIGISRDYRDKLFGIFQRLHTSQNYPGSGIGLAIVKKAAERMGGEVGVESEPDKGSRFWVDLLAA
jgi:PAS domain S-box-containing protein